MVIITDHNSRISRS